MPRSARIKRGFGGGFRWCFSLVFLSFGSVVFLFGFWWYFLVIFLGFFCWFFACFLRWCFWLNFDLFFSVFTGHFYRFYGFIITLKGNIFYFLSVQSTANFLGTFFTASQCFSFSAGGGTGGFFLSPFSGIDFLF